MNILESNLEPGQVLIEIDGLVEANRIDEIENLFLKYFGEKTYRIIFDIHQVPHLSSAAATVLQHASVHCLEHRGRLIIVGPSTSVRDTFELMQCIDLTIATDLTQAMPMIS